MNKLFARVVLAIFPKRLCTELFGRFAKSRISRITIPWYIRRYHIDVSESSQPVSEYPSLVSFFSRSLAPGARPLMSGLIAPVDGTVSDRGRITEGTILTAKGYPYTVAELLGDARDAEAFDDGEYIVLYLSPRDYHRVHMPVSGALVRWRHVPGKLYPVNRLGVLAVPRLFAKNERLITFVNTDAGALAIVKIGAAMVGGIRAVYAFEADGHSSTRPMTSGVLNIHLEEGDEVGRFEFGSTVILFAARGVISNFVVEPGQFVHMGQTLATLRHH